MATATSESVFFRSSRQQLPADQPMPRTDFHRPTDNDRDLAALEWQHSAVTSRHGQTYVDGNLRQWHAPTICLAGYNGYNLVELLHQRQPGTSRQFQQGSQRRSCGRSVAGGSDHLRLRADQRRGLQVETYLDAKWFGIGGGSGVGNNLLPVTTPVTIAANAALDLNGRAQAVSGLSGPAGAIVGNSNSTLAQLILRSGQREHHLRRHDPGRQSHGRQRRPDFLEHSQRPLDADRHEHLLGPHRASPTAACFAAGPPLPSRPVPT